MTRRGRTALVVVDVQAAIDDPVWGRRGQPEMEPAIAALLACWRDRAWPVIHVRHDSTEPRSPYRPGQPGNAFKPEAAPLSGEFVLPKSVHSAFVGGGLQDRLRREETDRLAVVGVLLENSVDATVRMGANLGYAITLPADAVASIDRVARDGRRWTAEQVHALWLSVLDGEYAEVSDSRTLIAG